MSRAVDEWGKILQRQSEWHRQRDIAEALKQVEDKHAYRQNLDYQQHLKQMNLERQRMEKQADFHDVVNRARVINDQEAQRRAHEVAVKKLLAQDYQQHLTLKKQRELEEKQQRLAYDQQRNESLRQHQLEDERRRREQQHALAQERQVLLDFKRHQDDYRRQLQQQEKQYEMQMVQARRHREEVKDRNYREFYKKLTEEQVNQAYQHNQRLLPRNHKAEAVNAWVDKSVHEHQAMLMRKDDYEQRLREANQRQLNESLRQQVTEKELTRQRAREERLRETEEVARRVEFSKKLEYEREMQKKLVQTAYRDQLLNQASFNSELKRNTVFLSDVERRLNRQMLDPQDQPRSGSRSLDLNAGRFFGTTSSPPSRAQYDPRLDKITRTTPVKGPMPRPAGVPSVHNVW